MDAKQHKAQKLNSGDYYAVMYRILYITLI